MSEVTAEQLGNIFAESLIENVSMLTGIYFDVLTPKDDVEYDGMIGMMSLYGNNCGMLFISADDDAMRVLCSYMLGVTEAEVTRNDLHDAICELVNMTAGGAKLRLSGVETAFTLSSPFVVRGSNLSIENKKRVQVISRRLGKDNISITMKILFY